MGGLSYSSYQWRKQSEWMLTRGRKEDRQVIIIPPLFEEMNVLRGVIADIAVALTSRGVASWLPDLPGTGESLRDLASLGWTDWRDAVAESAFEVARLAGDTPHIVAFRGGALLADAIEGQSCWSYAPASGASLLRHLQRSQAIAERDKDRSQPTEIQHYLGYVLSREMRDGLAAAEVADMPVPHRTLSGAGDARLWLTAEPSRDRALSQRLAQDIARWIATCEPR